MVVDGIGQDIEIVEVFNPIYDIDKKTLKYERTPDNSGSIELPNEFEESTLITDDIKTIFNIQI